MYFCLIQKFKYMKYYKFIILGIFLIILSCSKDEKIAKYYTPILGEPQFIIPSSSLPRGAECMASNNNCGIIIHENILYAAWRTAETHFASANTKMHVISSADLGKTWKYETTIFLNSDIREPNFLSYKGKLHLYCFMAGTNPLGFEPKEVYRITKQADGSWSEPIICCEAGLVPWDLRVRNDIAYMMCYKGEHYSATEAVIRVYFKYSLDGENWQNVGGKEYVYEGGVSEVSWDFDKNGDLWAVTRNEDGDASGFGSHLAHAYSSDLSTWHFPTRSNPNRYDAPRMFTHEGEIYLIARRDIDGPFDARMNWLPFEAQRAQNLASYSLRKKRTALYKINTRKQIVEHLLDFPSAGDNAFPSIAQISEHSFLISNYTSPIQHDDWNWLQGQLSTEGTQVYLIKLEFKPVY